MIRTSNNANAPPSHCYIDGVMIQGIARRALADTGSAVNCVRAGMVGEFKFPSNVSLFGPTGKALVIDANYIVETIDGIPQKLYIVPGLTEEVILGEPYFTRATPVDILHINTWDEPVDGGRLRRLSAPELEALDELITTGLEDGLVRPSQAGVAAKVIVVPKKDGRLRICVDYRKLNAVTKPDKYPLPLIRDLLETAASHLYFRLYNLKDAFHNVAINPPDIHKTAFKTHRGLYEYTRIPFGLTNALSIFQRYLEYILRNYN
jgi:hypothetical protein